MIPFDARVRGALGAGLRRRRARRRARRDARLGRRELPLRPQGAGRRRAAARRRALRDARRASCWRSTARSSPRATSAGSCSAARSSTPASLLGDPFTLAGEVVHGDERGRELGYPTANLVPDAALRDARPRRLRGARATTAASGGRAGGGQHRRAPDVRHRPRRAHRGLPAGLRRRPLRQPPGARVPQAPARREALRVRRRARRPDGARRRRIARTVDGRCLRRELATVCPSHGTDPGTQAGARQPVRRQRPGHRQHPRPGRAAHRAHQPAHRASALQLRRTTTRAAGC